MAYYRLWINNFFFNQLSSSWDMREKYAKINATLKLCWSHLCLMQNQIQNHHNLWNQLTSCWENWDFLILQWKMYSLFFCQILCSGRVAQWSTHWPLDLKVRGLTPPWGKFFFILFYNFFVKLDYFYIKCQKKWIVLPFSNNNRSSNTIFYVN